MSERSTRPTSDARTRATRTATGRGPRRWLRRSLYALLGVGASGLLLLGIAYAVTDIPQPNQQAVAQTTILYYSDGKTVLARLSDAEGNRESVPLSKVPKAVQDEFLAAEDRNFYTNQGISVTGIARAVKAAATGGDTQGGSTITQQYVKNFYLTQDQTVSRKFKEILISLKIDRQLSKDQILENYLNTIYFGRGASGIQTASKAYFNKDVSQLTPSEGALLASVIRGPSLYDPRQGEQATANAQARWAYVLDGMVSQGWMSATDRAAQKFPTTVAATPSSTLAGPNGYIATEVRAEVRTKLGLTDAQIDTGGLRIVTTIDKAKQDAAVKAVTDRLPSEPANLHVGLASIKPGDGAVQMMYGGADYLTRQFNDATQATIQAGSTFKIFTLLAALQNTDLSTASRFSGASPQFFDEFEDPGAATNFLRRGGVQNFGNSGFGRMNLLQATANSVNTIYAQVNAEATPQKTMEMARAAGVTTQMNPVMANVFGTDNVRVIDMANAYATIAASGQRAEPYLVKSMTSVDGAVNYTATPKLTRAFAADIASDVIEAMERVVQNGSGTFASRLDRPAAGKTGTTTDNYGAWFDGFVPQLATAVAIYRGDGDSTNPDNRMNDIPGVGQMTGGTIPVRIWTDYMQTAVQGLPVVDFPTPAHVNYGRVSQQSNNNNNGNGNQPPRNNNNNNQTPAPEQTTSTPSAPVEATPTPSPTIPSEAPPPPVEPTPTAPVTSPPGITITLPPGGGGRGGGGGGGNNAGAARG